MREITKNVYVVGNDAVGREKLMVQERMGSWSKAPSGRQEGTRSEAHVEVLAISESWDGSSRLCGGQAEDLNKGEGRTQRQAEEISI